MARKPRLTSIPTPTHIVPAVAAPLMVPALPERDGYAYRRQLLVPREINDALGSLVDRPKIRSTLQRYLAGVFVTGSMQGDPRGLRPDFERLETLDEVWVMCFRQPRHEQWRLMGRFIKPNSFVGLGFYRREFLNGKKHYQKQAELFLEHWNRVAIDMTTYVGHAIEDYISQPVRDPYAATIL